MQEWARLVQEWAKLRHLNIVSLVIDNVEEIISYLLTGTAGVALASTRGPLCAGFTIRTADLQWH